jgi:hypothetical protein
MYETIGYAEFGSMEETIGPGPTVYQGIDYVEFGPLGETTQSEPTLVWLASGSGTIRRYIPISVNPVTGVSSIGDLQATSP